MTTLPDFQIPKISSDDADDTRGTFVIEPLDKGFGYTFGNSLRRVLLSSLGGAAITSVRIEGVAHEFSTIPGVKEDVPDLVLNLKDVVIRMHTDADEVEAPLVVTGPGSVTAKDIDVPAGVEVLNPSVPIATLEKRTKLEVYLTIGRGRGYSPAEENKSEDQPIGVIPIDSIFSPIRRASYSVDSAVDELTSRDGVGEVAAGVQAPEEGDDRLIEELEIGVRAYNCLKRAGIQTIGDLVQKSESELKAIPNFGDRAAHRKSLLRNLSRDLIQHERIKTSQAKARAVKPEVEKLITLAKRGDLHARRQALSALGQDRFLVHKLFEEVAPRYAERPGGYTRIVKLGPRRSDSTEMVFLELV